MVHHMLRHRSSAASPTGERDLCLGVDGAMRIDETVTAGLRFGLGGRARNGRGVGINELIAQQRAQRAKLRAKRAKLRASEPN